MRTLWFAGTVLAVGIVSWCSYPTAAEPARAKGERVAFGLDQRVPWTTSNVKGSPEPPPPYRTERAFAKLTFSEPLDLVPGAGTDRLFVAERWGKVHSFVNRPEVAKADLVLHLEGKDDEGKPRKQVIYAITT